MQVVFDHLVHFIAAHPQEAVQRLGQLGLHAVMGGRHENWGTQNSLCYVDLSYIEFLALERPKVAEGARAYGLIDQLLRDLPAGDGLGTIALRTHDMAQAAETLRSKGVTVTGPFPGQRQRADGQVIRWKMLFLESESSELPLPFLIEWEQSDEARRADLQQIGAMRPHPAGELRLGFVACAVRDLEVSVARWRTLFDLEADAAYLDDRLHARCQRLRLPGGDLLFCQPVGPGLVAEMLQARGERPFLVQLDGRSVQREDLLWGAYYRL